MNRVRVYIILYYISIYIYISGATTFKHVAPVQVALVYRSV